MPDAILLLIDDEGAVISAWKKQFAGSKFNILEARSGLEALEQLEKIKNDEKMDPLIVLLDYKMPGLNGLDVLKKIKGEFPFAKVYIITGNVEDEKIPSTAYESGRLGGDGFFEKAKLDFESLKERINQDIKIQEDQLALLKKAKGG